MSLSRMDADSIRFTPEGVRILPIVSSKQGRVEGAIKEYFFPWFEQNALNLSNDHTTRVLRAI